MWNTPSADKLASLPKIGETDGIPLRNKIIHLHLFLFGCDWYLAEFDGEIFFGFAILNEDHVNSEWGHISFSELKSLSYKGFEVECDEHWTPRPAGEIPNIKV